MLKEEVGVDLDRDTFDEYAEAPMEDYDEDDSGTLDFREFHKFYNQVLANENTKAEYAKELESAVSEAGVGGDQQPLLNRLSARNKRLPRSRFRRRIGVRKPASSCARTGKRRRLPL